MERVTLHICKGKTKTKLNKQNSKNQSRKTKVEKRNLKNEIRKMKFEKQNSKKISIRRTWLLAATFSDQ